MPKSVASTRRKSQRDPRTRCCRNKADQWRSACALNNLARPHPPAARCPARWWRTLPTLCEPDRCSSAILQTSQTASLPPRNPKPLESLVCQTCCASFARRKSTSKSWNRSQIVCRRCTPNTPPPHPRTPRHQRRRRSMTCRPSTCPRRARRAERVRALLSRDQRRSSAPRVDAG